MILYRHIKVILCHLAPTGKPLTAEYNATTFSPSSPTMQLNVLLINLVALAASASCLAAGPAKRDAEIAARRTTPQDGTNPPIRDLACVKRCQDQQDMECVPLCVSGVFSSPLSPLLLHPFADIKSFYIGCLLHYQFLHSELPRRL